MKIVVTNGVVSNTGDAAIFAGIRASLLEMQIATADEITLLDSNAKRTSKLYRDWTVLQQLSVAPPRRWMKLSRGVSKLRRAFVRRMAKGSRFAELLLQFPLLRHSQASRSLQALKSADLVISTGGTYLVDHYDFSHRVVELALAKQLGKRVVLWTQSAGPFETKNARERIRLIIDSVDTAYFRDELSRQAWIREGGSEVTSFTVPDAAFALDVESRYANPNRRRVLISVREWPHKGADGHAYSVEAYQATMRAAAEYAVARRHGAVALSTCQGLSGYVDDSSYALEVFHGIDIPVNREFHTPDQLLEEVKDARVVVTTRMHLAILAIAARVPVIGIAYEFKTIELFESLGLGRFVTSIESANVEWVTRALQEIDDSPDLARLGADALERVREAALLPARHLAQA